MTREDQVMGENGGEIHGDILEVIFSHVPLIDLVPASHVSKSWGYAVTSSLSHFNKPKPWLILHKQATRYPYTTSRYAYDPRSHMWIKISQPSIKYNLALKSSNSNFLYMLSSTKLSFSFDPLNISWSHVDPPLIWRTDPIVAKVGDSIVVVGGGSDYEDDPLPVEIYNTVTHAWDTCDTMPGNLKDSAASTWLSIATTNEKLFITEKQSGLTYWFDPNTKCWSRPNKLNPNQHISDHNIGTSNDDLILVGLCKNGENVEQVKIWKVDKENFQCEEIVEMPLVYVDKLKSESIGISSINVHVTGNFVYIYNQSETEEVVVCELIANNDYRWWSIQNVVAHDEMIMNRLVFTCSRVGFDELQRIMRSENQRFEVES
ncbi:F-box/kelch-repeat protein At1g23390-like [Olea europaea var. sylvestris]|uniref:F-box/kelch-repeat protein At1g23390-like n=1 Tax=Olea europaea var. sylvestris TaxID=158386 RepID=UPI000C1CFF0D|nr:F-box/kelch-repeat protein At1g23390-like [Olea europaea var. sylvestris]